jgi:hypothetical protein
MYSPLRAGAHDMEQRSDDDALNCPALLDLEGSFISSFISDPLPTEQYGTSPFPFSSLHPDSSRTLTRLTQRLALDTHTRKLGHDAYASSSSDADESISGSFTRATKVNGKDPGAKDTTKAASKSKAVSMASRGERLMSGEVRRGSKSKQSSDALTDEQELHGFVVPDGDVLSE